MPTPNDLPEETPFSVARRLEPDTAEGESGAFTRAVVLTVAGDVDLHSVPELWAAIRAAAEEIVAPAARSGHSGAETAPAVILDLSGVDFLDSAGVALLFEATRHLRELRGLPPLEAHHRPDVFSLCGVTSFVRRTLHVARVDRFVPIYDSLLDALQATANHP